MSKYRAYNFIYFLVLFSYPSIAEEKYVSGNIESIEACAATAETIFIFITNINGAVPSENDGCSNGDSLPYVRLDPDSMTPELKQAMFSMALTGYASNLMVKFRYDDTDSKNRLISILLR